MPIKLDCPRCKHPLSIPARKAGSYVNCPRCQGQFWVPDAVDQAAAGSRPNGVPVAEPPAGPSGAAGGGVPLAIPPASVRGGSGDAAPAPSSWSNVTPQVQPAVLPAGAPRLSEPGGLKGPPAPAARLPGSPSPGAVTPPASAPPAAALALALAAARGGRGDKLPKRAPKVARFISTEAAQSSLKLAEDGKLPELHLREPGEAAKEPTSTGTNPLVLFGLLCLSIVMTLALVLVPTESREGVTSRKKEEARQSIEREYFRDMDSPEPRKPYQVTLREAQQAHARGDFKRERELYRDVLGQLRAERGPFDRGVTGSQQRDRTLEELIETLLAGGS